MTRDARGEAAALTGFTRDEVRVLEPSPPASRAEPWCADDRVAPGGRLSPLGAGWLAGVEAHPAAGELMAAPIEKARGFFRRCIAELGV